MSRAIFRFCSRRGRLYSCSFGFSCHRAVDRGNNAFDIGQRSIFVNRVVTDHDVAFTHQNRWADHRVPKIDIAGHVGDDHLPDTAIFRVLLDDDDPAGFAHRFRDRLFVPRHDRAQIEQLDAHVVVDLGQCFERFLDCVAPRDQRYIVAIAKSSCLAEGNGAYRFRRLAFRPKHVFGNEKENGIFAVHRRPEQTGRVFRRARDDDT